jgi:hypothetical protein
VGVILGVSVSVGVRVTLGVNVTVGVSVAVDVEVGGVVGVLLERGRAVGTAVTTCATVVLEGRIVGVDFDSWQAAVRNRQSRIAHRTTFTVIILSMQSQVTIQKGVRLNAPCKNTLK